MNGIRFAALVAVLAASGCSVGTSSAPAYPTSQPVAWSGPPGGAIDPGYGYGEPGGADGSYEGSYPPEGDYGEPSSDPNDPNYALGDVTDIEIEATLQAHGEWVEDPAYGYVWLPYTTVVGEDFTPYDSSGEWVYTDYGWSFASDFDWGWLAFHFGRWMLYEDRSWGWVPERQWAPHWCEWRSGGNTVGWRPMPPRVRDNTTNGAPGWRPSNVGPANRRPNKNPDAGWSFAAQTEFGLRNRPTAFAHADGLRSTSPVVRPPAGTPSGRAAALMGGRLRSSAWQSTQPRSVRPNVDRRPGFTGARPQRWGNGGAGELGQSTAGGRPWMTPPANGGARWQQPQRPTWNRPPDRAPQRPTWSDGSRGNGGAVRGWQPSNGTSTWNPPSRPSYGTVYQPPRPSGTAWQQPTRPSWNPPSGTRYNPPARPSWSPPRDRAPSSSGYSSGSSRPSWSPPRDRAPSSSGYSSGGSRPSWSPPRDRAPSSGSFSPGSSGGSRSYSPPSSSGGSRSYSAPSSSGGSRSYSAPSSSGGSRSPGSSSSSGSSRSRR
ncbi:MAG: hypothetical protein H0T46_15520 [Deltaproteobacteria bacterium]|nr:hypothetical protein [Deltaproteobacteria bacterium]